MVLSMPFSTSTTPLILLNLRRRRAARASSSSVGIGRKELDLDRLGCVREVADHVLQHLRELDIELRLGLLDLLANIGHDLVDAAASIALELDGDVAVVRLGYGGEAHLQAGAAAGALDFRGVVQNLLDVVEHAVGLGE